MQANCFVLITIIYLLNYSPKICHNNNNNNNNNNYYKMLLRANCVNHRRFSVVYPQFLISVNLYNNNDNNNNNNNYKMLIYAILKESAVCRI